MIIGIPRETHRHEHRVGLTPWGARQFVLRGHTVVVEKDAGLEALFPDHEYEEAGAQIVYTPEEAYMRADLVCRVGMFSSEELDFVRHGSAVGGFLHMAVAPRGIVQRLRELEVTAIGYELIEDDDGDRSILVPFSEMAGQMAVYTAAHCLKNEIGGRGILLGSVPGIAPPTILILGAGTAGRSAARRAFAIGAHVIVLDQDLEKLRAVSRELSGQVVTQLASPRRLEQFTAIADVVIGAVLIPGAKAPFLVTEDMVRNMRAGSVFIDLSIDQGGCSETSRPTTLDHPTYVLHDVVHFCVPNMTADAARTASRALSDAVLAPVGELADKGVDQALRENSGLAKGVYLFRGKVTNERVAAAQRLSTAELHSIID